MDNRPRLRQAVIVEGKYDKIKLETLVDALILPTDGFRIFKDADMRALIRTLARETGIVVLTDSDAAGFLIRRHLRGVVGDARIIDVYIPDIAGKEPRKARPSKAGTLGVEGVDGEIILGALREAGLLDEQPGAPREPITRMDLYDAGLSGGADSRRLRAALLRELGLPARITSTALPGVLDRLLDREALLALAGRLREELEQEQ